MITSLFAALPAGSLVYLASPYSPYVDRQEAYEDACLAAATLQVILPRLSVYSPIAETHGLVEHGGLHRTHAAWLLRDAALVGASAAVAVAMLPGWHASRGVAQEIQWATEAGKPVVYAHPAATHRKPCRLPPPDAAWDVLWHGEFDRLASRRLREDVYRGEVTLGVTDDERAEDAAAAEALAQTDEVLATMWAVTARG